MQITGIRAYLPELATVVGISSAREPRIPLSVNFTITVQAKIGTIFRVILVVLGEASMTSVTQQTIATGNALGHVTRPARALIGWMQQSEAQLMLAQRIFQLTGNQSHADRAAAARQTVAARPPLVEELHILNEPGPELNEHIVSFVAQPDYQPFVAEGWSVKIADLSKVVALQPMVFWDHAQERTDSAVAGDMPTLAKITLPIRSGPEPIPVQFDPTRNTWMITSRNPNLRIVGQFSAPIDVGGGHQTTGCGFLVTVSPSFVQVVRYRSRLLLRDGYHRSLGLLAKGITQVPVLFREFGQFEPLGLGHGMLPEAAYLGDHPPYLADYLIDAVSAEVNFPASQKMLVIQGIEMNPMG